MYTNRSTSIVMKKPATLLQLVLVALLLSHSASAQTFYIWRLIANNLSDQKLEVKLCFNELCYIRAPKSVHTLDPKGVAVYGADDPFDLQFLAVTDLNSGRKLERTLWYGQINANNTANILSVVPKSSYVTEVWFSDKSGKNVLLGILK